MPSLMIENHLAFSPLYENAASLRAKAEERITQEMNEVSDQLLKSIYLISEAKNDVSYSAPDVRTNTGETKPAIKTLDTLLASQKTARPAPAPLSSRSSKKSPLAPLTRSLTQSISLLTQSKLQAHFLKKEIEDSQKPRTRIIKANEAHRFFNPTPDRTS